jgi:hypothetical protein
MSDRITINYTAPVQVVVNLETKTVEQVIVLDESIRPDFRPPAVNTNTGDTLDAEDPRVQDAYDVADRGTEWPGWAFGW